jgi:hypothetical protein
MTSLEFLRAVYSDPELPLHTRLRAAVAAAPYEHPRLSLVAAVVGDTGDFAARLELAKTRSMKVIEARTIEAQPLQGDVRLPPIPVDRRFRRI